MHIYLVTSSGGSRYLVMGLGKKAVATVLDESVMVGTSGIVARHSAIVCDSGMAQDLWMVIRSLAKNPKDSRYYNFTCRLLSANEKQWLLVGSFERVFTRMMYEMQSHLTFEYARRWSDVVTSAMADYRRSNERYVFYHNRRISVAANYEQRFFVEKCTFYKELGVMVRNAIVNRNTEELSETIMDNDLDRPVFDRIKECLSVNHSINLDIELAECDHYDHTDNIHHIGRRGRTVVCNECYENEVEYCEDEGYHDWRDNLYYHESDGNYYSYEEEEESDDYDSDPSEDPSCLMSYSTNVLDYLEPDTSINSSTHGDFRMGIELEMCARDMYVSDAVRDVRDQLGENYCIAKSDGSLPNGGFEVVTAPRGLAEHIKRFNDWDINSDYRAWNTGKCGMHIHIHSKAFTGLTLGKFIMLVNSNENAMFIRDIAGRHPLTDSQARDFCASESQEFLRNPSHAIKGKSSSRYRMVNCENLTRAERDRLGLECEIHKSYNTIELRIFRATLKKERLLAQIEFTHALVMFCRVASWRDLIQSEYQEWHDNRKLKQPSFIKWLKNTNNQYPHLCDWYGIRRRPNAKNSAPAEVSCTDVVTADDTTTNNQ